MHGNCSWSGFYCVRAGGCDRSAETVRGHQRGGFTRFRGPHLEHMAGGFGNQVDFYLHDNCWDSYPGDGRLCLVGSQIKHMPCPYIGAEDRVIVSFHAQAFYASGKQNYGCASGND